MQKMREYLNEHKYTKKQWIGIKKFGVINLTTVRNIDLILKDSDPEVIFVEEIYYKGLGMVPVFVNYG